MTDFKSERVRSPHHLHDHGVIGQTERYLYGSSIYALERNPRDSPPQRHREMSAATASCYRVPSPTTSAAFHTPRLFIELMKRGSLTTSYETDPAISSRNTILDKCVRARGDRECRPLFNGNPRNCTLLQLTHRPISRFISALGSYFSSTQVQ